MGRAIDNENDIYKLKLDVKELQGVVAELSMALKNTKQTKHVDLVEDVPKKKTKKKVEVEAT